MNEKKFQRLWRSAKTLSQVDETPNANEFWNSYIRGLRRNYHGENFGNPGEHETWMALTGPDETRRFRGIGYRAGFEGLEIEQARAAFDGGDVTTVMVRKVPAELQRRFKSKCAENGISLQAQMIELMKKYVEGGQI
ncbi:MAG: hypothetical protein WC114_10195 [Smithellaceae bacterium]|jgi:hypothetical protein